MHTPLNRGEHQVASGNLHDFWLEPEIIRLTTSLTTLSLSKRLTPASGSFIPPLLLLRQGSILWLRLALT